MINQTDSWMNGCLKVETRIIEISTNQISTFWIAHSSLETGKWVIQVVNESFQDRLRFNCSVVKKLIPSVSSDVLTFYFRKCRILTSQSWRKLKQMKSLFWVKKSRGFWRTKRIFRIMSKTKSLTFSKSFLKPRTIKTNARQRFSCVCRVKLDKMMIITKKFSTQYHSKKLHFRIKMGNTNQYWSLQKVRDQRTKVLDSFKQFGDPW